MTFFNETPFSAELFEQLNMQGRMNGVVAIRGTFIARPDRRLRLADIQAPFAWEDGYVGNPLSTPLVSVGDLIPFKPGTDITFLGSAYTPDARPRATWVCGIDVSGHFSKSLRVYGPRSWLPRPKPRRVFSRSRTNPAENWRLGEADPAREVPMCWTQAFGGGYASSESPDAERFGHPDNWIGVGWTDRQPEPNEGPRAAPRIEAPDDPVTTWVHSDQRPQSFAPIPPFWNVRRRHAGTMDADWLATRHPLPPEDFDYRFWQSAMSDCVVERWLNGHEIITLRNLSATHPSFRIALPGLSLTARLIRPGRADDINRAALDGVHFDFRDGSDRVFLTWRCGFPWPDGTGDVVLDGGVDGR